jgi:hypothetical protein
VKKSLIPVLLLLTIRCTTTQTDSAEENRLGEFFVYDNGLIYDRLTMSKLGKLVDSLNLQFKKCKPKNYHSLEQGYGTYISITKNVRRAREAMRQNMELESFLRKFRTSGVKKNLWIVKEHINYGGKRTIQYRSEGVDYMYVNVPDGRQYDKAEGWIYQDNDDGIEIFYLHKLKTSVIPVEYARLIQYVDCMIDTTATIFPEKQKPDSVTYFLGPESKVKEFVHLAMDFEAEPKKPQIDIIDPRRTAVYKQYDTDVDKWDARRITALDKKMQDKDNVRLLNEAVEESISNQNGFYLDRYAERYLSPAKALELKRSFRVRGFCSADSGPRDHAKAICKLAAETYQWDIFLRAHLDILNDNFERVSDGAWARKKRETYINELEALDINTVDLLIGTILTSSDVSDNHYQAVTSRIGRALTESKHQIEIENLLLSMTQDESLDVYNRMEMAYSLIFYNRSLKDKIAYRCNLERIKKAVETLPGGLSKRYSPLMED